MSESWALPRAKARVRRRKRPPGPKFTGPWWYFALIGGSDLLAYVRYVRAPAPHWGDVLWSALWGSLLGSVAIQSWRWERYERQQGTFTPTHPWVLGFMACVAFVVVGTRLFTVRP